MTQERVAKRWISSDKGGLWLLGVVAVAYFWFAVNKYRYELDDALIYMRYIRNLVDGFGLVYNRGERFDGLTSPLFSYLTAALALVSRNVRLSTWLASAIPTYLAFCTLYLVWWKSLGCALPAPRLTAFLGLVIAVALPYFFSTYGMETGLFVMLCALTLKAYLERHWDSFCVFGTLLVLTRPEGLALIGACGLYFLARTRSIPPLRARHAAFAVGALLVVLAANLYFFGTLWSGTGAAKIWQGRSGYWGDHFIFLNVKYLLNVAFAGDLDGAIVILVGSVVGILALGMSEINVVVLLFLTCYGAFYTLFNIPNYHWYYSAFFLFLPFWCATGCVYLATTLVRGDSAVRAKIFAVAILCLAAYPIHAFVPADAAVSDSTDAPYARAGRWIAANTPPESSFAAAEIGALGWYSKRRIIDILGLVNDGNARLIGERNFDGWMDRYRPDYLLVHEPLTAIEMSLYTFVSRYTVVQLCDFPVAGYSFFKIEYRHGRSRFCKPGFQLRRAAVESVPLLQGTDAGHVDSVTLSGNFVRMTGWATGGVGKPFAGLVVPKGRGIDYGLYEPYGRPDVADAFHAPGYARSGYNLVLRFASHTEASAFAAAPCLLTRRNGGAAALNDVACRAQLPFAGNFDAPQARTVAHGGEDAVQADSGPSPEAKCPACPVFTAGFEGPPAPARARP